MATPIGQLIPLGALADVTLSSGPEQVNHRERIRAITIEVSPPPRSPLEDAMQPNRQRDRAAAAGKRPAWPAAIDQPVRARPTSCATRGGLAVQRPAGAADHVPADGGAVRIVAVSAGDHFQRAAGSGRWHSGVAAC